MGVCPQCQERRACHNRRRSVHGTESSSSSATSIDSGISYHPAPLASTPPDSVASGMLIDVDPPLDQAEVEYNYHCGIPLREIPDSPPTTIAKSFFKGPAVTQGEHEEVDRRFEEADEEICEMVLNTDADALRGWP